MIRKNVHFTQEDIDFINNLSGTFSEHIRTATRAYIDKKKELNSSASAKGGENGTTSR
jgi:hypothetical protein